MKKIGKKIRIGELAQQLKVERFVIRFWEKEFAIDARRSNGGQRFYTQKEIEYFQSIKELLYEKGFTIAGAKKHLQKKSKSPSASLVAASKTTLDTSVSPSLNNKVSELPEVLTTKIVELHKKLMKLRELL